MSKNNIIIILTMAIISILVVSALLYVDLKPDDDDDNENDGTDDETIDDDIDYEASVILYPNTSGNASDGMAGTNDNLTIFCDIASTDEERQQGLMYVTNLSLDRGMLFIFDEPAPKTFWMKNVEIPLDIVFIGEDLKVLNVEEAIVENTSTPDDLLIRYLSEGSALYVLEMNYGLAAENNITAGTEVSIIFS